MEIDLTKLAEALEKATPGPWSAECHFGDDNFIVDEDDTPVCTLHSSGIRDVGANAALIALAPTLAAHKLADAKRLEAAEMAIRLLTGGTLNDLMGMIEDGGDPKMRTQSGWFLMARDDALSAWDEANGCGG